MMQKANHKDRLNIKWLLILPVIAVLLFSLCDREIEYIAQDGPVVSGKVTVAGRIPVPDVYIGVKGETTGTATDANGVYRIALNSPGDTLEVIHRETELIFPNGRRIINIELEDSYGLLGNIFRILGPDCDPVVIVNGQRIEKGLQGDIDARHINTLQVLEGEKAVQKFGSEDARRGLVIITRSERPERYYIILLNGKKYDGTLGSINPHAMRSVGTFGRNMLSGDQEGPYYMYVTTKDAAHIEKIDPEILQIVSGEKILAPDDEPVVLINGKRYDKSLRTIDPDDILSTQVFTGDLAVELSGLEEAGKRKLVIIMSKNPYE